jgi:hypothetical protein
MILTVVSLALAGSPLSLEDARTPGQTDDARPAPIINGEDAEAPDYPMTGAMLLGADLESNWGNGSFRTLVCSSTLIAPDVVLLAAHCLSDDALTMGFGTLSNHDVRWSRQADQSVMASGMSSRDLPEWPSDAIVANAWVSHPDFDIYELETGIADNNHDIALLFLDEALDVAFAYLPTADEATQIAPDLQVEVVGWGQQVATDGPMDPPPKGTYGFKQMGASYLGEVGVREFQVGLVEDDVRKCHGDSGGPTFLDVTTDSPQAMRVIGVTSHAYDTTDCNETGGVDTRVDAYLEWIEGELTSACADGRRSACDAAVALVGTDGIPPIPAPVVEDGPGDEETAAGGCACDGASGSGLGIVGLAAAIVGLRRRR